MIQLREHIKMYSIAGSEYKDLFERPQVDEKKRKSKKKLGGSRLSPPFTLDFCCCIPSRQIGPNSKVIHPKHYKHLKEDSQHLSFGQIEMGWFQAH